MSRDSNKRVFELVGEIVSIFQRGTTWHANFQFDGKQHRQALKTTSKKEARRRAIQLEAEILQGRYQHRPAPPAVTTVVQDYVNFLKTERRAAKTLSKYERIFDRVLELAERRQVRTIDGVSLKFVDAYRSERSQGRRCSQDPLHRIRGAAPVN